MNITITEEQARNIRHWRKNEECTFGRVAELVWEYFPELHNEMKQKGSIVGRELCELAMNFYDEEIEDGWN